ncbi:MAG TPA: DNA-processing protein DprA, partial [Acidimicrobiales bacterium]|nr:DNA-processing protein DprA [Acidimicrobiales bacterium]
MSELAVAAFAAATDSHLLDAPRSARFERFRAGFDETRYRHELASLGIRWVGRGEPGFPARLAAIHDPPPGLFVRGRGGLDLLARPCVAVVGARACSGYGAAVARELGRE